MALGEWWSLLRRHSFAIDLKHSPRALVQTAVSATNSVNARIEHVRFGRRIDATEVQARYLAVLEDWFVAEYWEEAKILKRRVEEGLR